MIPDKFRQRMMGTSSSTRKPEILPRRTGNSSLSKKKKDVFNLNQFREKLRVNLMSKIGFN